MEVQNPFPIVPFLKGGPVFPNEEQCITRRAPHLESGSPFIQEDHSHLTSAVACGPQPNLELCFRIPPSLFLSFFFVIKGWGWGKVTVGSVSNQIEMQRDHYLGREEKICCRRESRPQASTSPSLLLLQRELCSLTDDELGAGQGVMKHHQIELSAGSLEREMTAKAAKNQFFRIVFFLAPFTALPSQRSDQGYLMRGGRGKPGVYKMDSQVGA